VSYRLASRIAKLEAIRAAKAYRIVIRFIEEDGTPCQVGKFHVPTEQELAEASRMLTVQFVGSK
jgi:hypothetical protein